MAIKKEMINDVAVLILKGKLMGGPETTAIHEQVKELVEGGAKKVILDLTRLQDKARGLFSIAKLDTVFKIYGSTDRAAADF